MRSTFSFTVLAAKMLLICTVSLSSGCREDSEAHQELPVLPEITNPFSQRFAARFCYLAAQEYPNKLCTHWLHGASSDKQSASTSLPTAVLDEITTVIVSGLFNDCVGRWFEAFEIAAEQLRSKGYRVHLLPVAGRGTSNANAEQINASLRDLNLANQRVIAIGYSKGANDLLDAVNANLRTPSVAASLPEAATRPPHPEVLVTLGAAAFGSELMALVPALIRTTLEKTPFPGCRKAESDVLSELLPDARKPAMESWQAPANLRLFSLAAAPTKERVSRILQPTYKALLDTGSLNDGQVSIRNAMVPNATPLGYLNGDHWAVALPMRDGSLSAAAPLLDQNEFPRAALLQAIIDTVAQP